MDGLGRPFSNGTETEMFEHAWCRRCVHAFDGNSMCDEVALPVVADWGWPDELKPTEKSRANPLGIICTKFKEQDE